MLISPSGLSKVKNSVTEKIFFGQEPSTELIAILTIYFVQGILGLSLPGEDNSAEAERAIVREVIIYIILAGAFGKISQPWYIHQQVVREVARQRDRGVPAATSRPAWLSMLTGIIILVAFMAQIFSFVVDSIVGQAWKDSPSTVDLSQPLLELSATLCRTKERPLADQAFWLLRGGAAVFGGTCDSCAPLPLSCHI